MNLFYLAGTLVALVIGPLLYRLLRSRRPMVRALDLFVMVSISLLVALEVIPGTYGEGGWPSLLFLVAGALGPSLLERVAGRLRREAHLAALYLALGGLVLHAMADGAGLAPGPAAASDALGVAVVIHSIPVGLMVWWLVAPALGQRWAAWSIAAMALATVAGYGLGAGLNQFLGEQATAWMQALIAGSILHVVFGRPHLDPAHDHAHAAKPVPAVKRP